MIVVGVASSIPFALKVAAEEGQILPRGRINWRPSAALENNGAARGIRTPDPIITNDVLYQLSYCGMRENARAYGKMIAPRA